MIKSDPDEVSYTTMTTTEPQSHGRDHLKRKLTLNIGSANNLASIPGTKTGSGSPSVIKRTRAQSKLEVLTTPDLQLLKLGSPEIERLILSQTNNLQTPTPISQYFLNNTSPKNVTQEQEIYVKGFQEALSKLHQQNAGVAPSAAESDSLTISAHDSNNNTDWSSTCSEDSSSMHQTPAAAPATMKRGGGRKNTTRVTNTRSRATTRRQTSTTSSGSSVTNKSSLLNPIDMGSQEKIKLERKRQRNRVAASKCRKRKLERIAKLEVKVNHLKVENGELNTVATKLRDSVNKLKAEIEHHVSMGCNFDHLSNLLQ